MSEGLPEYEVMNLTKDEEDDGDEKLSLHDPKGLSFVQTCIFLCGELAGTGVLALPFALEQTGLEVGIPLLVLSCLVAGYTGSLLGESWIIVQSRHPEYRGHVRHPYPTLAYVTFGKTGRFILSCCNNISLFGSLVVVLIVANLNLHKLLLDLFDLNIPFCYLQIITAVTILPFTWFGTPKNFWLIGLSAAVSTAIAVVLIVVCVAMDEVENSNNNIDIRHSPIHAMTFFQAAGTMVFANSGHQAFLTIQNDMERPAKFGASSLTSFFGLMCIYVPVAVLGFSVYGRELKTNVLLNMDAGVLSSIILLLITTHQLCSIVIVINPMTQHLEEVLNSEKKFSWRRLVIRSAVVFLILFTAETIPRFGPAASLMGGSTNILVCFIAPPLFYMKLCTMKGDWPGIVISLHRKVFLIEIIVVSAIIGAISTYGSILELFGSSSFTLPCYLNMNAVFGS